MLNFASVLNNLNTGLYCVLLFFLLHSTCAGKSGDIISKNDFSGIVSAIPGSELLPTVDIFTITVVGTVDGNIHAIDHDYNLLWTSSTGGPLARGAAIKSSSEDESAEYVIPTLDGTLLLHNTANGMRKTSISARLLAEKTPFISGEGLALTGAKEDKIFGLDLTNGNSLLDRQEAIVKLPAKTSFSPSKFLTKKRSIPILFGREDFIFRGIDAVTGSEKFSFSYAEIFPLLEKNKMSISTQDTFQTDKSNGENVDDLQDGEAGFQGQILSTPEGFVYFLDKVGDILNNDFPVSLQSPAVAAFKVLIKDGEAIQTKRLSVKHSLHQLRNSLRLRQPKVLPSSLVSSTAVQPHKTTVEEEQIPFSNPLSSLSSSNMVIVQGEINEGTQESTNLYAMEIIVPSELPSNLPVTSSTPISAAISHDSDKNSVSIDSDDEIHGNIEINNAFLLECDAIFEAEKSETLGKPSSSISKTRLNLNIRQSRKPFVSSTYNGNQQLTQDELRSKCHNLKKYHHHNPDSVASNENEKEWRSLDEYLLEYDDKLKEGSSSIPIKLNRIRGLHKLTINEPHEEFWLPKIQKDIQRHMDEQRKSFTSSLSSSHNRDTMKANKLNQSVLNHHLSSFISILSSFVTFLFIFLLLMSLFIIGYILHLPPNAKISEQTDIARFFIPYISFQFPVIRSFLVHYFVDLDHILTKGGDHDNNGKTLDDTSNVVVSTSRNINPNILSEVLDEKGRKVLKVGALRVYEAVLGVGSHGTVVFVGTLHARPVAVKRMLKMLHRTAEREMSLLIKSDGHPNVVRYFIKEECNDFIYLGLQLCVMSVKDFVLRLRHHILKNESNLSKANCLEELLDDPYGCFLDFDNIHLQSDKDSQIPETAPINSTVAKFVVSDEVRRSLLQIAQGLSFLHSQKILHRDLKPHNILLSPPNEHAVNKDDALSGYFRSQYFVDEDNQSPMDNFNKSENNSSNTEKRKTNAKIVHLNQLGEFVLKISDMGLSKQLLDHTDASFSRSAASLSLLSMSSKKRMISSHERPKQDKNGINENNSDSITVVDTEGGQDASLFQDEVGTIGWQAPEIVRHHRHKHTHVHTKSTDNSETDRSNILSSPQNESNLCEGDQSNTDNITANNSENQLKADIFSLGCVFYYVLSLGGHPFGAWYEREQNIIKNNCNLSLFDENCPEVSDLLGEMLQTDAMERPSAIHVAQHPFFWSSTKRLEFLTDFSDSVEKLSPDSPALLSLEAQGHFRLSQKQQTQSTSIFRGSWDRFIDPQLLHDGGKYRRYDARSVKDLLRLIRNKKHHFLELPVNLRETLGNVPQGYLRYFESRFPRLLLHCVRVAVQHLKEDKLLSRWMEHLHLNPLYITSIDQNTPSNNVSQKSSGKEGFTTSSQLSALSPSFIPSSLVTDNVPSVLESSETPVHANILSNKEGERTENNSKESITGDIVEKFENISTLESPTIDVEIETVNSPRDTDVVMMNCNDFLNEKDSDQPPTETDAKVAREMTAQWETQGVVVWRGSSLEQTLPTQCRRGWLRDTSDWVTHGLRPGQASSSSSKRPQRLTRQTTDLKYRSRLCSHWEMSGGTLCPMRKRGKCAFAHSPLELRVKENRRDKWPTTLNCLATGSGDTNYENCVSGGEDVLTAARHSDPSILALYKPPSFPASLPSVSVAESPHRPPSLSPVSNMHHFPFPVSYAPASATYRVPAENSHHFSPSHPSPSFHSYHHPASHMPSYPQYSDPNHLQYSGGFGYSDFGSGGNNDSMNPRRFPHSQSQNINTEG